MQVEKINLDETDCFGNFFLDYLHGKSELSSFYAVAPNVESVAQLIGSRSFSDSRRATLVGALKRQYDGLEVSELTGRNIDALADRKTFTITTGHQLNIFTGPLYFLYKIVTAINTAKTLKAKYPEYHFVPVYWMATEDHDLEEIDHFKLNGQVHKWTTSQTGAVGRMTTTGFEEIWKNLPGDTSMFKEAYNGSRTLAEACRYYVNALFGAYGLVVIDGDDAELKATLRPVIEKDLFENLPGKLVNDQTTRLEQLGYKSQIYCRDINFFYLDDGLRVRIERNGDRFALVDANRSFSETEIREMLKKDPEKFSPNVALRPLYQELILPNLAYIGGPAEMVYWLQLKSMFDTFDVPFPMLLPRNFALLIPTYISEKWSKTGLPIEKLFLEEEQLKANWVKSQSNGQLSFDKAMESVEEIYSAMREQAEATDPTLGPHIAALEKQAKNRIALAEKKLVRAEKRKQSDQLNQVISVKEALFPNNALQERTVNFMEYSTDHSRFIQMLVDTLDPFDFKMWVLRGI